MDELVIGPESRAAALTPVLHNLHRIEALEPCAILDVTTPPYSDTRACTYYGSDTTYTPRLCSTRILPSRFL